MMITLRGIACQKERKTSIQDVHHHLTEHGIKLSVQRAAIMQYLMDHLTHPTIDQIFNDLLPVMPSLSKTTVYNTLKLFHDKGAVVALTIDEKNVRYDGDTSRHAHFKCRKCGIIYDMPLKEKDIPTFRGSRDLCLEEIQVNFLGMCKQCR